MATANSDTAAPTESATTSPAASPDAIQGGLLIIVTSKGGGLLDGSLTVDPAADHFVWFTDRPQRQSGAIAPEELVKATVFVVTGRLSTLNVTLNLSTVSEGPLVVK